MKTITWITCKTITWITCKIYKFSKKNKKISDFILLVYYFFHWFKSIIIVFMCTEAY